jgi:DNA-directed RNA polymerase specialized sigma24 family protein
MTCLGRHVIFVSRTLMTPQTSLTDSRGQMSPTDLDGFIKNLAIWHARKLVYRLGLPRHEAEDIQQEIHLALWLARERVDTIRGAPGTFLRRVAENEVRTLIAHRRAARRGYGKCRNLDDASVQGAKNASHNPFRTEKRLVMRMDVRLKVAYLPSKLRRTAKVLERESPTDAALRLNTCRDTIHRRMKELRRRFAGFGLDGYLN